MANLLVVDDEVILLSVLEAVLTGEGHLVRTVATGEDAIQAIGVDRPDLVLCDIMMPHMSGLQVLEKARDQYPDCPPFLFISAQETSTIRRELAEIDHVGFLGKPFEIDELFDAITDTLSKN